MPTNYSGQYQGAIRRQLDKNVLPLTIRYLVSYEHATKIKMDTGAGVTWTATRFNRLPLPSAPLAEGVPPIGETMTISQVTGVALQWGDRVILTDVSETTTLYDLTKQAERLLHIQIKEMTDRNAFAVLASGTQVNYVNSRGARASLVAGDVMDLNTINRTYADLENIGAPFYNGQVQATIDRDIDHGARASSKGPMDSEHYVAITSPFVEQDLRQNPTVVTAWSYSDVTRLYINEIGYLAGIHFTKSNMLPRWTGVAVVTGTPGTAGNLVSSGNYVIQVTANDTLNQFGETLIYQVSGALAVTGPNGSISVTLPSTAGYLYNIYISQVGATTPTNLGLTNSPAAQTVGPLAGQAALLPPGTTAVITGIGLFQIPPAAPATGVTVYPTFVFGKEYYACLQLENVKWTFLGEADKSDPLNQLRVIGWKLFEGFVICNQQFGCRIESSVSNSGAFG